MTDDPRLLPTDEQGLREVGSHHGDPQLFERDIHLIRAYQIWIRTAHQAKPNQYPADWTPSTVDCLKSRLFWRIRSGKKPLPHPPPCAYSCPWYELIEDDRPHWCWEEFRIYPNGFPGSLSDKTLASVAQSLYDFIEKSEDGIVTLAYGPYRFKAWRGQEECPAIVEGKAVQVPRDGWYLQYLRNVEIV